MATVLRSIALLTAVMLALAACGDDDTPVASDDGDPPTAGDASLDGREFWSTSVTADGVDRPLVDGTRIALRFDDGNVGASAGCNSMGGSYRIVDGVLVVDGMSTTEMGCDPARHDQDDFVAALLTARPAVTLDGIDLTLATDTVTVTFVDRSVADPDRPLQGTRWVVTGFVEGSGDDGVAMSMTVPEDGWVVFGDSRVDGFDGCNDFGGPVEIADGSTGGPVEGDGELQFGEIAGDGEACDDIADYQQRIQALFAARQAVYEIEGPALTITAADGAGVTFRADDDSE